MASINTQPISDAHDKIFDAIIKGIGKTRELSLKVTEKAGDVPPLKDRDLTKVDERVNEAFDAIVKGLQKQHDFVEEQLAKLRD